MNPSSSPIIAPVTDSPTCGIQEAIDALPGGGIVQLDPGVYVLHRSVVLRTAVTLRGAGTATVLRCVKPYVTPLAETTVADPLQCTVADAGPFQTGDQIWLSEVYVSGRRNHFGYRSRYLAVTEVDGNCIKGEPVYAPRKNFNYRVEENAFAARLFPAILILEAHDVTVTSLMIDGGFDVPVMRGDRQVRSFMTAAVLQHDSPRTRLMDLAIRRWHSDGICAGGASSDVLVTGCVVEDCHGYGLHTGGSIQSAQWRGNIARRNHDGFLFCQQNRNVICTGNLFSHNRDHGICGLGGTDRHCIISDNVCHTNGKSGIEASGSVGNVIRGNICRNNSQTAPGEHPGILLANHGDNIVTGNLCLDDQPSATQLRGLEQRDPIGDNVVANNVDRHASPTLA